MINYIIWNGSQALFSLGTFSLRWYGILFVFGFLLGRRILMYIYKTEGKPLKDAETLAKTIFIATIIGARLGYVIFYQPELILSKPFEILLPFGFQPQFHFTGLEALSGHGAFLGILIAIWFFCRKRGPGQGFLRVLDSVVIPVAIACVFIGIGNFLNAEIEGKPTGSSIGVVFARPVTDGLTKIPCCVMRNPGGKNPLSSVSIRKDTARMDSTKGHSPILLYLFFRPGATEQLVNELLIGDVKGYLFDNPDLVYESGAEPLHYTIFQEKADLLTARIRAIGIARHPTQLYESISFLALFIFMLWYRDKYKVNIPAGRISGFFMVIGWGLILAFGCLKENQVAFEDGMPMNMGQILSIPFVIYGIIIMILSFTKVQTVNDQDH
jgi:phosphatidylglycerol---prolipoprotein diacylglyceryl transferase